MSPSIPPTPPPVFDQLNASLGGSYRIERELGRGGMATVYLAEDLKHRRQVAVKVLRPELAVALGAERFLREVEIAASLSHPHVVPVYDSGATGALRWYVMPYIEGESLRDRIEREGPLSILEAVRLTQEIASALDYAHRRGLVHRDVKPENVLLADGKAVVADFGIARLLTDQASGSLTGTGISLGTPGYMSPEQAAGDKNLDGRSDLYSLGCVLYEMLVGHPPFLGATAREVLARHALDPVPPIRSSRPVVPVGIEGVLSKAMAKAPADRYRTTAEFAEALGGAASGAMVSGGAPVPSGRPGIRLAIGSAAVAVIVAVGWLALRPRSSAPAGEPIRIAVLPLRTVGGEDPEYFADGLTEEITNRLTRVSGFAVIARHNQVDYGRSGQTPQQVGQELGVDYVLAGTVRWTSGPDGRSRFKVSPAVIRSRDGETVFGEGFEGEMADLFRTQAAISEQVAAKVRGELLPAERTAIRADLTEDVEAYKLYVRGRYFWKTRTADGLARAAQYFREAIERDPRFARAHSGLADAYILFSQFGVPGLSRPEAFAEARHAAERALALDSSLAEAQASLGEVLMYADWNWAGAEARFLRAIELDPDYATAHQWYSELLLVWGRIDGAVAHGRLAVGLDPVSPVVGNALGWALLAARRFDSAQAQFSKVLESDSTFGYALFGAAHTAIGQRDHQRAIRAFARLGDTTEVTRLWVRGVIDSTYRRPALDALRRAGAQVDGWSPDVRAAVFAGLHDVDRAFAILDDLVKARSSTIPGINSFPLFDPIRSDPRFDSLLARVGWKRSR